MVKWIQVKQFLYSSSIYPFCAIVVLDLAIKNSYKFFCNSIFFLRITYIFFLISCRDFYLISLKYRIIFPTKTFSIKYIIRCITICQSKKQTLFSALIVCICHTSDKMTALQKLLHIFRLRLRQDCTPLFIKTTGKRGVFCALPAVPQGIKITSHISTGFIRRTRTSLRRVISCEYSICKSSSLFADISGDTIHSPGHKCSIKRILLKTAFKESQHFSPFLQIFHNAFLTDIPNSGKRNCIFIISSQDS